MAKNAALGKAKDAKQDEFYTQLADIENELRPYGATFAASSTGSRRYSRSTDGR